MHGNVWEWCQDPWHKNYQGAPTDGRVWNEDGDETYRVLRGGSWYRNPRICRSASRYNFDRDYRSDSFGFRVMYAVQ